jgi:hypothetical protein
MCLRRLVIKPGSRFTGSTNSSTPGVSVVTASGGLRVKRTSAARRGKQGQLRLDLAPLFDQHHLMLAGRELHRRRQRQRAHQIAIDRHQTAVGTDHRQLGADLERILKDLAQLALQLGLGIIAHHLLIATVQVHCRPWPVLLQGRPPEQIQQARPWHVAIGILEHHNRLRRLVTFQGTAALFDERHELAISKQSTRHGNICPDALGQTQHREIGN